MQSPKCLSRKPPKSAAAATFAEEEEIGPDLSAADRKELSAALEVFGAATVRRALNKAPSEKGEAIRVLRQRLEAFKPPSEEGEGEGLKTGKMMRAAGQILARLLRAQVIGSVLNEVVGEKI